MRQKGRNRTIFNIKFSNNTVETLISLENRVEQEIENRSSLSHGQALYMIYEIICRIIISISLAMTSRSLLGLAALKNWLNISQAVYFIVPIIVAVVCLIAGLLVIPFLTSNLPIVKQRSLYAISKKLVYMIDSLENLKKYTEQGMDDIYAENHPHHVVSLRRKDGNICNVYNPYAVNMLREENGESVLDLSFYDDYAERVKNALNSEEELEDPSWFNTL